MLCMYVLDKHIEMANVKSIFTNS